MAYKGMLVVLVAAVLAHAAGCDFTVEKPQPQGCVDDGDCTKGHCDAATGDCVACLADEHCPANRFCHPEKQQCVVCFAESHCSSGVCDLAAGYCVECLADADCPSGNCDEANQICIECDSDAECKADNPCLVGVCEQGKCVSQPSAPGTPCEDGDPCTSGDQCVQGKCQSGQADPACLQPSKCKDQPDGTPCEDGDKCTLDDYCFQGKCVGDTVAPECLGDDVDGDGFSVKDGDCNDLDPSINPVAPELCDFIDNNCDGQIDDAGVCGGENCVISGCSGEICGAEPMESDCQWLPEYECLKFATCEPVDGVCGWQMTPAYYECMKGLCDPKNPEICDGMDNDCDGEVDEGGVCGGGDCVISGCSGEICAPEPMGSICIWLPEFECLKYSKCGPFGANGSCGWLKTDAYLECMAGLCDPTTPEVCDGIDNDCDGAIDEGGVCGEGECGGFIGKPCPPGQYCLYPDGTCGWADQMGKCADMPQICPPVWAPVCACNGKTYGNWCEAQGAGQSINYPGECEEQWDADGDGWSFLDGDCDDNNAMVYPGAPEYCDGLDNDCNGLVDEECGGECIEEGQWGSGWFPGPGCCPGLVAISVADWDPATGNCAMVMDVFLCARCGDGICQDKWENPCNCQEDCSTGPVLCMTDKECNDGDLCTLDYCVNGLCIHKEDPNCAPQCIPEGGKFMGGPDEGKQCCAGLVAVADCEEWPVDCDPGDADCPGYECSCKKCLCFVCTACGNGICGKGENKCNCPEDCIKEGQCVSDQQCDDQNDCTVDYCKGGKCLYETIPNCGPGACWEDSMCPAGSYCRYPDGACDNAKSGSCAAVPVACFFIWDPVCGCDGKTYGNECEMQMAKQSLASWGECSKCKALDPWGYGMCNMFMGYGFNGKECVGISGCGCKDDCAWIFKTIEECKKNCF